MSDYSDIADLDSRCVVCGEFPDYCQGGHGWACPECDGYQLGHAEGCALAPVSALAEVEALAATLDPDSWSEADDDTTALARFMGAVESNDPLTMAINLPESELRVALAWLHVLADRASR